MSHISKDVEPESAEMERQQQCPRRPTQIQIGDCVVAVRHAELAMPGSSAATAPTSSSSRPARVVPCRHHLGSTAGLLHRRRRGL